MELCWKKVGREGRSKLAGGLGGHCWTYAKISRFCGITQPGRHPHGPITHGILSETFPSLYSLKGQSPWLVAKK